jgi:hypothetical protein
MLSVEVDGNLLPPNIVNKLNIFMVNVLRFRGGGDLSSLVDAPQGTPAEAAGAEAGACGECEACAVSCENKFSSLSVQEEGEEPVKEEDEELMAVGK